MKTLAREYSSSSSFQKRYVSRLLPLRIRPNTRRHASSDLETIRSALFSGILIDDDNYVVGGIAVAQIFNQSWRGQCVRVYRYSAMNEPFIRNFIEWTNDIADRHHWSTETRDVELQFLDKHMIAAG